MKKTIRTIGSDFASSYNLQNIHPSNFSHPPFISKLFRGALLLSSAAVLSIGPSACSSSKSSTEIPAVKNPAASETAKTTPPAPAKEKTNAKPKPAAPRPKKNNDTSKAQTKSSSAKIAEVNSNSSPNAENPAPNPVERPFVHANAETKVQVKPHDWTEGNMDRDFSDRKAYYSDGKVTLVDNRYGEIISVYDISPFVGKTSSANVSISPMQKKRTRAFQAKFTIAVKGASGHFEHTMGNGGYHLYYIEGQKKTQVPKAK